MGVTLMAHANVRARMMKESVNRQGKTVPPRDKEAWPMVTFNNQLSVFLNGQDIELVHLDRGHTDGDVVIYFRTANVMHTGDAFVRYGYPFIDVASGGGFAQFVHQLDQIYALANDDTKIIPGHGAVATRADVMALRNKLTDIGDQVAAALKKGSRVEDIPALGITDKYEGELGKGFIKGKDFVLLIAEQMKVVGKGK
jgi:cyclase